MSYTQQEIYAVDNLTSTEKVILNYIYSVSEGGSHPVGLSFKDISKACSMTSSTAIRNITSLVDQGYLIKQNRMGMDGRDEANQYTVPKEFPEGTTMNRDVIRKNMMLNDHLRDDARWMKAIKQAPSANILWVSAMALCRSLDNDGTITEAQLKVSCRGNDKDIEYMLANGMLEPVEDKTGVYRICDYEKLSARGELK